MTTNIQIGLREDNAPKKVGNHSRHAHTDIFGVTEPVQPTPTKSNSGANVKDVLVEDETDMKKENKNDDAPPQQESKSEGTNGSFQRVRMPPGGHSTALW